MRATVFVALMIVSVMTACDNEVILVDRNKFSAQDTFSVDVTKASRQELVLRGVNGTISVTGASGAGTISIFAVKRVEAPTQSDADKRLSEIDVTVDSTTTPDALTVETVQPKDTDGRNYLVYYTVTVPQDFNIVVNAANGEVTLKDISGPGFSRDTHDASTQTTDWAEVIPGLKQPGEVTFGINFVPTDPSHDPSTGLIKDFVDGTLRNFRLIFPDPGTTTWQFAAYVTNFEPDAPVDGVLTASVTISINGDPAPDFVVP